MSAFLLSQIVAGLAFVFGLSAYQFQNRTIVLTLLALAQMSNSAHFFLLGATAGGVVVAVSALRYVSGIWSKHYVLKYFFIKAAVVAGIVVFENLYDVLPIIGGVLGTLAAFTADDMRMRQYLLGGTISILLYNIFIFSPVAILAGLFFLGSALLGYWRFYIRKQKQEV